MERVVVATVVYLCSLLCNIMINAVLIFGLFGDVYKRQTEEILKEYGYSRYEISNYAKEGYECRHNIGYWRRTEYLGQIGRAHV